METPAKSNGFVRRAAGGFSAFGRGLGALVCILALGLAFQGPSSASADISSRFTYFNGKLIDVGGELECLALTIYHEARGEPKEGKLGVANVVMNRVADPKFPSQVCDVVRQGGESPLYRCQFSWWCDGRSDRPRNEAAWQESEALAFFIFWGFFKDVTDGSLWYHADYVSPEWRHDFDKGPKLGRHIFYRRSPMQSVKTAHSEDYWLGGGE